MKWNKKFRISFTNNRELQRFYKKKIFSKLDFRIFITLYYENQTYEAPVVLSK